MRATSQHVLGRRHDGGPQHVGAFGGRLRLDDRAPAPSGGAAAPPRPAARPPRRRRPLRRAASFATRCFTHGALGHVRPTLNCTASRMSTASHVAAAHDVVGTAGWRAMARSAAATSRARSMAVISGCVARSRGSTSASVGVAVSSGAASTGPTGSSGCAAQEHVQASTVAIRSRSRDHHLVLRRAARVRRCRRACPAGTSPDA